MEGYDIHEVIPITLLALYDICEVIIWLYSGLISSTILPEILSEPAGMVYANADL